MVKTLRRKHLETGDMTRLWRFVVLVDPKQASTRARTHTRAQGERKGERTLCDDVYKGGSIV